MDYAEKNFEKMKKFRPTFYDAVKKVYENKEFSEDGIEESVARDGNKVLLIERDGQKVRLNSMFRPVQEAEKWADQYNYQNLHVPVFLFGMGNGIFLRELLRRLGDDAVVFVMEPDVSIFFYQVLHQDLSDIVEDERVLLFVKSIDDDALVESLDTYLHWSMLKSQIVCHHPGYDKLYLDDYVEYRRIIKRADEIEIVNCNTINALSKNIVPNILKNLHFIRESNYAGEMMNILPEDVPVIVVSAGPSLDKNICEIKKAVGKAFIIATDTAVKYLLQNDVPFDVMVTLDANKSPRHICDEKCKDVPLLCTLEARNQIMEFHTGRKIWFRSGIYLETLYKKMGRRFPKYNTGGSVATASYMISIAMGAKRIILVGQDLAYSGNVTHAGGIEKHVQNEERGIKMIEGIDGKQIRSRGDWIMYRDWFEEAVGLEEAPEVIDATEGGALIKGTKIMKLSEAIKEYCVADYDFQEIVNKMPYTFDEDEYQKIKQECSKLSYEFVKIRNKAKEAAKIVSDLQKMVRLKENNPVKENKKVSALRKINKYIDKQSANELLEIYSSTETTDEVNKINTMTDNEDENMTNTLRISYIVYKSLVKSIENLQPLLEESLLKM